MTGFVVKLEINDVLGDQTIFQVSLLSDTVEVDYPANYFIKTYRVSILSIFLSCNGRRDKEFVLTRIAYCS